MEHEHYISILIAIICGIVSAKWAMELGFSQLWQVLWGFGGLLLGPLALLTLYIRLVRNRQALKEFGGQWILGSPAAGWHKDSSQDDKSVETAVASGKHIPAMASKA